MISWEQAREIIRSRQLELLVRSPEQLRAYRAAKDEFQRTHGGTANFIIAERLRWAGNDLQSSGDPFLSNSNDIRILENDFSYDFAPGIRHFVVWSKVPVPCDSNEFPTADAESQINAFIDREFTQRCGVPREDIQWFKNTGTLQSVPSVSHFHVLVRNCSDDLARAIIINT